LRSAGGTSVTRIGIVLALSPRSVGHYLDRVYNPANSTIKPFLGGLPKGLLTSSPSAWNDWILDMTEPTELQDFMLPGRAERLRRVAAERTRNLVMVLDGVHDPHNLSAVVRSCDAFGLLDLHVIETNARFRVSRKVSQGAEKWLDIHRWPQPEACAASLLDQGFQLWLADARPGSLPVDQLAWDRRLALVFGNEHAGASDRMRTLSTGTFHIPMNGFAQSFNVSVAVGISLALAQRGRQANLGRHGDLSEAEIDRLALDWQRRSVRASDLILRRLTRARARGGER